VSVNDTPDVTPPPRGSSTKALAVTTVVVSFAVGMIVGAVAFWGWIVHHHGGRAPFFGALGEHRIVRRLDHELNLTPSQHEEVARIIHVHHERIETILGGLQPEVRREFTLADQEIDRILTPEQRAKFAALRLRLHSRRHMPEASSPAGSPNR